MRFLQTIKESPHYLRLKNSVQYRYDRRQFVIFSVIIGISFVIMLPLVFLVGSSNEDAAAFVMVMFLMMGYFVGWLFITYHWLEIFRHIDSYIFFQARLDQPHVSGRGGASFTVEFTDRHGKTIKRDTSQMFSSQWEPYLEDYINQTVLIGYNEETDRLVVIERVNT